MGAMSTAAPTLTVGGVHAPEKQRAVQGQECPSLTQ